MQAPRNTIFDAATAISVGKRDYQEDAVISDCPFGGEVGLIVLADGMGGHASGDIASKIVLTEVFSELRLRSDDLLREDARVSDTLRGAALAANDCLRAYVESYPQSRGMGATLVAACLRNDRLHWISVGDSALYLFREGSLRKLNEEHSLGAEMDEMVREGRMVREFADEHPNRNYLTSVLSGQTIARMDCPVDGCSLMEGDIVVAASDGLEFLERRQIEAALNHSQTDRSAEIAARLLCEIELLGDPEQDNVSVAVVKIDRQPASARAAPRRADKPAGLSLVAQGPATPEPVAAVSKRDAAPRERVN